MKRSLSIILSLLLTCVILLTSCNTTRPESLPIIDETQATEPVEIETQAEAATEPKLEAEPEEDDELTLDVELDEGPIEIIYPEIYPEDETDIVEPEVIPEEEPEVEEDVEEEPEIDVELETKDEAQTEAATQKDTIPAAKSYTGIMHYPATNGKDITCNIDFIVDYKMLLDGSNKTYSKDLAKLSILYACDIYKDL